MRNAGPKRSVAPPHGWRESNPSKSALTFLPEQENRRPVFGITLEGENKQEKGRLVAQTAFPVL
jgi:hypothetical protein